MALGQLSVLAVKLDKTEVGKLATQACRQAAAEFVRRAGERGVHGLEIVDDGDGVAVIAKGSAVVRELGDGLSPPDKWAWPVLQEMAT